MEIVSVLVPLYNNGCYIESALNSLLLDRPERIELLVLDDGSTDDSLSVAEAWFNNNIDKFYKAKIWSHVNKGVSATLNELVKRSTGEYITILPADDELLEGGIDIRIKSLKANTSWLCVFGDARVIDSSGSTIADSAILDYPKNHVAAHLWALLNPKLITLELIIRWSVPGPVFLARRKAYTDNEGIGLYDENLSAEDRDYYLRLLASNSLGYVDSLVAKYRVHGSNVSTNAATTSSIRESVFQSEIKNLELFTGINYFALYVAYIYKRSISSYKRTGILKKQYYLLMALLSRMIMRIFDIMQIIRRSVL